MKNLFEINKESCNRDGICAAVCPAGLIEFQKGEFPTPIDEADELCIRCGHCVAVCPTASLSHKDVPVDQCPQVREELLLNAEHCGHFLRCRRSIRVYKDKPVPGAEIAKLIEMARYAPTGHNSQSVEWLVLGRRNDLRSLAGVVIDWTRRMLERRKEFALSAGMDKIISRWEEGEDVILRNAPAVIVAHGHKEDAMAPASCTIALSWLELAAVSMGMGCCWAGYLEAAAKTFPPAAEALDLPEDHRCLGAMMVGYPKYKFHRLPLRKNPQITWRL